MADKEESSPEISELTLIKTRDPFLRIQKKIRPKASLETTKQTTLTRKGRERVLRSRVQLLLSYQIQNQRGSPSPHRKQEAIEVLLPEEATKKEKVGLTDPRRIEKAKVKFLLECLLNITTSIKVPI